MKLYASPTSPYARLVRVVILEKELGERIERVWLDPWANPAELLAVSPFSRVPVFEAEDGSVLTESIIIALYMERRYPEPKLVPWERVEAVYRKLGIAQGLTDAAVGVVATQKFHEDADHDPMVQRRLDVLRRAVPAAGDVMDEVGRPDLGDLALAVALGYLSFRLPEVDWRHVEGVGAWYDRMAARPSLEETRPDRQP